MREQRFDMMKGVAIFMVVLGHVLTFCIREIDNAFLFKIVGAIHMPLFFFISGWFSFKPGFKVPNLVYRFRQLIIPGFVCMTLFFFAFPHTGVQTPFPKGYMDNLLSEGKLGYWFVFTLFLIMVYYAIVSLILKRIKSQQLQFGVGIIVSIIIFIANIYPYNSILQPSFHTAGIYFIPFMFGVFSHKYKESFSTVCNNGYVYMATIIACCFLFYVSVYSWEFPGLSNYMDVVTALLHISLAILALPLFTNWQNFAFGDEASPLARNNAELWAYLGRNSLTIYLLHYFFLFPLTPARELMREMHCGIVPTFILASVVAAFIISFALLLSKIISPSPQLTELMTGKIASKS